VDLLGMLWLLIVCSLAVNFTLTAQEGIAAQLHLATPPVFSWLLVVPVSFSLSLIVHEAGHWLAGISQGQRCSRFLAWPLEWNWDEDRWRFRFTSHFQVGLVDLLPSSFADFRQERILILLGGPLACFVAAALLTAASLHASDPVFFGFCSSMIMCLVLGIMQLVPFRVGSMQSDGYRLIQAFLVGPAFDRTQRDLLSPASHRTSLRPRDWPTDVIARLTVAPDDAVMQRFTAYLAYVHFLDGGDPQGAALHFHRFLEGWSPADAPEYALEAAYFLARHQQNLPAAQSWLDREPRSTDPWVRLRAEAAVKLAVGRDHEARVLIEQALAALAATPSCGAYEYEADLLGAMAPATFSSDPATSTAKSSTD
jgi:hypothetical protein